MLLMAQHKMQFRVVRMSHEVRVSSSDVCATLDLIFEYIGFNCCDYDVMCDVEHSINTSNMDWVGWGHLRLTPPNGFTISYICFSYISPAK